jgi:hypothetical protein
MEIGHFICTERFRALIFVKTKLLYIYFFVFSLESQKNIFLSIELTLTFIDI